MMKILTIKLAGVLQSYGNEATFARRTSYAHPSKSAIVGMLAASLGYRRDDSRIVNLNKLSFAVRVDQPGQTMTDFQIVEYDSKKIRRKLTYRDYLQDAVFVVAIANNSDGVIDQLESAIKNPKFSLFLGRRANVPAGPIQTSIISDKDPVEALTELPWQASEWYQKRHHSEQFTTTIYADADLLPENNNILVKDQVGSLDPRGRFHDYRAVAKITVNLKNEFCQSTANKKGIANCRQTDFDIFNNI